MPRVEFFRGNGSGKPTGLVSQVSVGAVSAEVGDICIDDVIDLIYSVRKPYREKSVLVMSDDAYFKLHKTKYANGRYIWNPNYDKDGWSSAETAVRHMVQRSGIPTIRIGKSSGSAIPSLKTKKNAVPRM